MELGTQLPQRQGIATRAALWRRVVTFARTVIAVLAGLIITASLAMLGLFVVDPNRSEEFTSGRRPSLFYQVSRSEEREFPDGTYADVVGLAHNSGGRIEAVLEAITAGADVIEVDVVDIDGELYSSHSPPIPIIGHLLFRGPSLQEIWVASQGADAIKLDLKESSSEYVEHVAEFLVSRPDDRDVIVTSHSPEALASLHDRAPDTTLLLSVSSEESIAALQSDEALQHVIDGVTVREPLIDAGMAEWLDERDLRLFAWTVNDLERLNELIRLGVDGVTTDNLALLALLANEP